MKKSVGKFILEYILIAIVPIAIVACFFLFNYDNVKELKKESDQKAAFTDDDLSDLIEEYKDNYNVINITSPSEKVTSLLGIKEDSTYESFIIDNTTGKELVPLALIKDDMLDEFEKKEIELLNMKYASFIVKGILGTKGNKVYEYKENELVIYYQGYKYDPEYDKEISLHINYNEIKDYLTFEPTLDTYYENEDGYNYDPNKVTVAFSFDDGPNNKNTQELLKLLEENKMTATFFMVGNKMANQSNIVKQVFDSPNEIGSHTYSHINMKKVPLSTIESELDNTNAAYKKITGEDLKLVRPPYGAFTKDKISKFKNYFILWNADTNDWRYKDVDYLVEYILDNVIDGNIILMHDSYETSVEAVRKVLPTLYAKDIQVVSVSTLAKLKGKTMVDGEAYYYFK